MNDLISIIVAIYNTKEYTRKCIESLLSQTYSNLQIILVDDGSTDGSDLLCDSYAIKDRRIEVLHLKNSGRCTARNRGLEIAEGKYIGFIDGDDYVDNDMFETLHDLIEEYNADISMVSYNEVRDTIVPAYSSNAVTVYNREDALKELLIDESVQSYIWNKLYKRELFNHIRFKDLINLEDVYLNYNIFLTIDKMVYKEVPKYNYVYRADSGLRTVTQETMEVGLDVIIERYTIVNSRVPSLDKFNCYSLILWMVRLYTFAARDGLNIEFIKRNIALFENAFNKYREYILDKLEPEKRIVVFLMLWDIDKSRNILKDIYDALYA